MKKSELLFSLLLVPLDYAMIVLAGILAYYIRFSEFSQSLRPAIFDLNFFVYFEALSLVAFFVVIVFALSGLYTIRGARKYIKEFYAIIQSCSTGLMFVVILIFVRRELFDSRFIVLAAWILAIILVTLARGLVRILQRHLYKYGVGVHKVILVGGGKTADNLMQAFSENKNSGFNVIKRVANFDLEIERSLDDYIKNREVDEVVQADPNLSKAEIMRIYDFADQNHITFKYAADLLGTKVLKTELSEYAGIPLIEAMRTPLEGWGRIAKRAFDIVGSGILIIIISPILILTAIAIKLDSHGPVFFSKKDDGTYLHRVGQGGELFRYFKFRSMRPNTDDMRYAELADKNIRSDGPMVKIKDDPRVTKFGRIIRRWSIDELPELFLVFRGDMSLVGPRPHLPEEVAKYERHQRKVLTVKPGISGLAQISGRSDLNFEEEVRLDVYYIENWSILFDITILLRTPLAVFKSRETE